jgi:hypothetical protein
MNVAHLLLWLQDAGCLLRKGKKLLKLFDQIVVREQRDSNSVVFHLRMSLIAQLQFEQLLEDKNNFDSVKKRLAHGLSTSRKTSVDQQTPQEDQKQQKNMLTAFHDTIVALFTKYRDGTKFNATETKRLNSFKARSVIPLIVDELMDMTIPHREDLVRGNALLALASTGGGRVETVELPAGESVLARGFQKGAKTQDYKYAVGNWQSYELQGSSDSSSSEQDEDTDVAADAEDMVSAVPATHPAPGAATTQQDEEVDEEETASNEDDVAALATTTIAAAATANAVKEPATKAVRADPLQQVTALAKKAVGKATKKKQTVNKKAVVAENKKKNAEFKAALEVKKQAALAASEAEEESDTDSDDSNMTPPHQLNIRQKKQQQQQKKKKKQKQKQKQKQKPAAKAAVEATGQAELELKLVPGLSPTKKRRPRWTTAETHALLYGCAIFGVGKWNLIRSEFHPVLTHRTAVNLKDRFRVLCGRGRKVEVNPFEGLRWPDGKLVWQFVAPEEGTAPIQKKKPKLKKKRKSPTKKVRKGTKRKAKAQATSSKSQKKAKTTAAAAASSSTAVVVAPTVSRPSRNI